MAIRKRGDALQIDVQVTVDGVVQRHREKFTGDMGKAKAREAAIKAALMNGEDPGRAAAPTGHSSARLPLGECLEEVWKKYWSHASVARTVRSNMKAATDFFGEDTCITAITTADADRYIADLKARGYTASTVRSKCAVMTKLFNHYHRRGNISSKPYFELPKVGDNMRDRIITEAEFAELLRIFEEVHDAQPRRSDGQPGQAWADWTVFLMDTGCRPSEGRVAETRNLNGRLLTLTKTKTGQRRTIPLTERALEAWERQAFARGDVPFEYATSDAYRAVWNWAKTVMNLSDDDGFIPYALRHTCATRLYDRTRDLMIVQRWLGHTDIKMTLRYAKLMPGDLERACDLLQGAPTLRAVRDASGDA